MYTTSLKMRCETIFNLTIAVWAWEHTRFAVSHICFALWRLAHVWVLASVRIQRLSWFFWSAAITTVENQLKTQECHNRCVSKLTKHRRKSDIVSVSRYSRIKRKVEWAKLKVVFMALFFFRRHCGRLHLRRPLRFFLSTYSCFVFLFTHKTHHTLLIQVVRAEWTYRLLLYFGTHTLPFQRAHSIVLAWRAQ